jgi:oleate hydratase
MNKKDLRAGKKRSPDTTEAWILGSGTASFAAALYLVQNAKIPAPKVHVLDSNVSIENAVHHKGDFIAGYDQFAGCLPVPVGTPLKELLASVPSFGNQGQTVLDDIQNAETNRTSVTSDHSTRFVVKRNSTMRNIPTKSFNLSSKQRLQLIWFILKREKRLGRNQIQDCLPNSFFQSSFWVVWSAQFGFQPWHSAAEFRRSLRLYLSEFHSLSILSCLDITGYYQHEYIFMPVYRYLHSLGVDFQFDTKVADIATITHNSHQTISQLELIQRGFATRKQIGRNDIVIMTLGSTVSGSATGTNDHQPIWQPVEIGDELDENWSLWLELGTRHRKFGNPYNFCTRQTESMMESFTITTEDLTLFQQISALSHSVVGAGAFISLPESNWRLNVCIPTQPRGCAFTCRVLFWGLTETKNGLPGWVTRRLR